VDFELWNVPEDGLPWTDSLFILWNLLIYHGSGDYGFMVPTSIFAESPMPALAEDFLRQQPLNGLAKTLVPFQIVHNFVGGPPVQQQHKTAS
jgi:hypothetical protein